MATTSLTFVSERNEGLLDRSLVAGVNIIELMLSHTLVKLVILVIQAVMLLFAMIIMFKVSISHLFFVAALLVLLQGLCGISFGFAISTLAREESEALLFTVGVVFPILIISGILWPLEGMPGWFQTISLYSPLTYSAEAIRSVFARGFGFESIIVWYAIFIVIIWSFIFDLIALICFDFDS